MSIKNSTWTWCSTIYTTGVTKEMLILSKHQDWLVILKHAAASDNVYQLVAHGRWFSPGTPVSSTTTTGRHDIAEILLKVALNRIKPNQSNQIILSIQIHVLTIGSLCLYFIWFWLLVVFLCLDLCFIKIRDVGLQLSMCHSPNTTHSKKGVRTPVHYRCAYWVKLFLEG